MTHSGGKPHTNVGDRGQRFEVTFFDPYDNKRKTFGWSATAEGARQLADSIELHPSWAYPQINDREADDYTVTPDTTEQE